MVVCAVKLCRNYTGKNIKPPEGISFHRFPTDADQKQEWIHAIRRESTWTPGTHCRVCSVHFESSDFKISETGRRILLKDAVPTKNLYREERSDTELCERRPAKRPRLTTQAVSPCSSLAPACRACLAAGRPMFALGAELASTFARLAGDSAPPQLCGVCCALLHKCAQFRARCHTARALMEDAAGKQVLLTKSYLKSIDRVFHNLDPHLVIKTQPIIDLTQIDVKVENAEHVDGGHFDIFQDGDDKMEDVKIEDDYVNDESVADGSEIFIQVGSEINHDDHLDNTIVPENKPKKTKIPKLKKLKKEPTKTNPETKIKEDIRNTKARKTEEDYEKFAKQYNVEIIFLTREEQIAEVKARKESDNYKNSKYKCDECYKGFSGENAFKNHRAKHDPSIGNYVCEPCGFRFPKRYKLLHHLTHHKMNMSCCACGHVSKLPAKAKEHWRWHSGVQYPCLYCEKTFVKRTSQFNHMRNRHGSACCDICQEIFSGERGLSAHIIKAHKEAARSRCSGCSVQFHSLSALAAHEAALHGDCRDQLRSCPQCGANFDTEELLNAHSKETHWKEIRCEKCNANFENEKLYRMHRIIHKEHRDRRPRSDPGKPGKPKSRTKSAPAQLQKRMCEMCGLTWRSAAALRYHQRVHTGEKPHQCAVCHKCFRIQDSLQIHMNTHTGARPFKCPHCPKAFKSRTQNHKHQLVHTKVRRYRCDLCAKTFQTSTCVKTHIKTVHMKIPMPPRVRNRPRPDLPHLVPEPMPDIYNVHNVNKVDIGNSS